MCIAVVLRRWGVEKYVRLKCSVVDDVSYCDILFDFLSSWIFYKSLRYSIVISDYHHMRNYSLKVTRLFLCKKEVTIYMHNVVFLWYLQVKYNDTSLKWPTIKTCPGINVEKCLSCVIIMFLVFNIWCVINIRYI